jgi:2-polyprenyl-3-methyl-5-hydroxy-6-metoxy-1,4-benzoquinol methylase
MNRGCQSIYKGDEKVFSGEWDPREIAKVVDSAHYEWEGKKVLDIGANTGGFSLEIARKGARVIAAEPDPYSNNMSLTKDLLLEIADEEDLDIKVVNNDFLSSHEIVNQIEGGVDVIFCFGLLYHFRYYMYLLDYLSSLNPEVLFVSTQTHDSKELALFNRVNPGIMREDFFDEKTVLTGWHPTRPLFEKMLEWSGFSNIQSLTEKEYNFPHKQKGCTNSAYYKTDLISRKDPAFELKLFYPR